jgi:peptidoglycan/xylan/chitin deacetylase (PgdA/CDA1 family)
MTAEVFVTPWGIRQPMRSQVERLAALGAMLDHLKGIPDEARRRLLDAVLSALGGGEASHGKSPMLSWDDVHVLMSLGFRVGGHTMTHPMLSRLGAEAARAEIAGSRAAIAAACGVAPAAFAYPNGQPRDYTETTVRLVREAGFSCAVTTRFGVNTPATSPWELRRGGPWEHDLATFALKLAWYRRAERT